MLSPLRRSLLKEVETQTLKDAETQTPGYSKETGFTFSLRSLGTDFSHDSDSESRHGLLHDLEHDEEEKLLLSQTWTSTILHLTEQVELCGTDAVSARLLMPL